jgi:hypothetical protein
VVFTWLSEAIHNVYIHPDRNCDIEGRIEIGLEPCANYTFMEDEVGKEIVFACDAFDHCLHGLHVAFTVVVTEEELPELVDSGVFEEDGSASKPMSWLGWAPCCHCVQHFNAVKAVPR